MATRIIGLISRHALLIVTAGILLAGAALYQLVDFDRGVLRLRVDSSLTGLLPIRGDALDTYRTVRERFGDDDVLLVAWFSEELFSYEVLKRFKDFTRAVQRIDGVTRVDGLANALYVQHEEDGMVRIDRLLGRIPRQAQALAAMRKAVQNNPLYRGQFLANDGRGALLAVHFSPELDSAAVAHAAAAVSDASFVHAGDIEQFVSGPVHARLEISRILFRDIGRALPLAIAVTALIAALSLRNLRGVILPLAATGLGLLSTLAVFAGFGHALNFVTAIMPPVVFVIGFAFAIHVVAEFDRTFSANTSKAAAVAHTLAEVFQPLTLTALTTTVGFASLASSPIESIRAFGIYTALGTALCWVSALILIPALLTLLPARVMPRAGRGALSNFAPSLARFDLRYRNAILGCGALLTIAAALSATRLEVSTDYLGNFAADSAVVRNFERIRTRFAGAVPVQIVFESDVAHAFSDPLHLARLHEFETWLETQPEVGAAVSVNDFIEVLNGAFSAGENAPQAPPGTRDEIEELFFIAGGDELDRFVDARRTSTLMHVQSSAVSSRDLVRLIERIDERLTTLPAHMRASVTGSSALLARTLDDIVRGQLTSLLGAMLMIYVILIVLFGSARVAALALLPNVLPVVCFFGLLGLTGTTLNLATSLVAAVILGIAVDDSMHFLSRFNTEARRVANEAEGIERALVSVIRPVTFTTAALCCGFLTLTQGELRSQVEFGALAAATLVIAWLIDLTFTPALAGRLRFVTLWEVLTVDLGASPHTTIPFFGGLTHRQARIAAILGHMETCARGDALVRTGEPGRDILIMIEGEAVAFVDRDDREHILRRLRRGDLIGEVALFRGIRTANVTATTPVRVLRFDDGCLQRIQSRNPRIAAQLYRNLGVILADRLADVTQRL